MNLSMGFLKPITGAVKKYKALLPSVIIAVVALLLLSVAMSKGGKVNDEIAKKSVRPAKTVQSLLQNIPSRDEPQQLRFKMDKLEEQMNQIKELATQSSQRDLITYEYKIFPEPDDQSRQVYFGFGKQYRNAIEKLIEAINALDAPSEAEIRAKTGGGGGQRRPTAGGRGVRIADAQDPRVDALCLRRAQEVSVYVNPSIFAWYPFWESYGFSGKSQALEDCWDSQVAFWVYGDIIGTIEKMNGNTGSVLSASVKRLLGVRFAGPIVVGNSTAVRGRSRTAVTDEARDRPNYVTPESPSVFLSHSPTGRLCNDEVDIIHFAVSVLLDSHFILPFMKELCSEKSHSFYPDFVQSGQSVEARHNQITILQSDLQIIDKMDPDHELYRYGKGAVVRLDLICEYQFNRRGYDVIKPDWVKQKLGQDSEDTERQNAPRGKRGKKNRPVGMPGMPGM